MDLRDRVLEKAPAGLISGFAARGVFARKRLDFLHEKCQLPLKTKTSSASSGVFRMEMRAANLVDKYGRVV